jgi:hypothetical protein
MKFKDFALKVCKESQTPRKQALLNGVTPMSLIDFGQTDNSNTTTVLL